MKKAALNSLFVILISQSFGMVRTLCTTGVPDVPAALLAGMVLCGIAGSTVGKKLNDALPEKRVSQLFLVVMGLVMVICLCNAWRFFTLGG